MIPSFNESNVVCDSIESILNSDYPIEKIEIIAVDDCSADDTWEWLQKMQQKYPANVRCWRNNPNKGKSFTLADIVQEASGDIVFTVDSDTIIAPNAIREILSCYADPDIGAVGGVVQVRNLNQSLWSQLQGIKYIDNFYLVKIIENQAKTSRCLSGPLASFRREIFLEGRNHIYDREFLGVKPIMAGEDTYMTTRVALGNGFTKSWKMFLNFNAFAWTNNPATFLTYHNQQLRWYRSGTLNGFFVISSLMKNIFKAGPVPVLLTSLLFIGARILTTLLLVFWMSGDMLEVLATVLWWNTLYSIAFCYAYNWVFGRHDKIGGKLKNPFMTGVLYGAWSLVSFLLSAIIAPLTMDDGGWVTRENGRSNTK